MIRAFSGNNKVNILDFTNKINPTLISSTAYANKYYTHLGWFIEDKRLLFRVMKKREAYRFNTRIGEMQDRPPPNLFFVLNPQSLMLSHPRFFP